MAGLGEPICTGRATTTGREQAYRRGHRATTSDGARCQGCPLAAATQDFQCFGGRPTCIGENSTTPTNIDQSDCGGVLMRGEKSPARGPGGRRQRGGRGESGADPRNIARMSPTRFMSISHLTTFGRGTASDPSASSCELIRGCSAYVRSIESTSHFASIVVGNRYVCRNAHRGAGNLILTIGCSFRRNWTVHRFFDNWAVIKGLGLDPTSCISVRGEAIFDVTELLPLLVTAGLM